MGDAITIVAIEIIQGGLVAVDFQNEKTKVIDRAFCVPAVFFGMIGASMQKGHQEWMEAWDAKMEGREGAHE